MGRVESAPPAGSWRPPEAPGARRDWWRACRATSDRASWYRPAPGYGSCRPPETGWPTGGWGGGASSRERAAAPHLAGMRALAGASDSKGAPAPALGGVDPPWAPADRKSVV